MRSEWPFSETVLFTMYIAFCSSDDVQLTLDDSNLQKVPDLFRTKNS